MSEVHPTPPALESEPDKTGVDAPAAPTKADESEVSAGIEAVTLADADEAKNETDVDQAADEAAAPEPAPTQSSITEARKPSTAFTAMLDEESLAFFNEVAAKPFSQQAGE
jgi:hypothetical protein